MKLEPETLFIGVIDFFSVMLPGAVVAYLAKHEVGPFLIGPVFPQYTSETAGWAVFLFASYLLGHFVFLLGAQLDDLAYDKIRETTREPEQPTADGKESSKSFTNWLAGKLFSKSPDLALNHVIKLKKKGMCEENGEPVINAFQWAKARLTIECPAALVEVQRFEADSKFFRSLVVVLLFLAAWLSVKSLWGHHSWTVVLLCVVLSGLSFWRYAERRFKATQQAYWYVITLEHWSPRDAKHKP